MRDPGLIASIEERGDSKSGIRLILQVDGSMYHGWMDGWMAGWMGAAFLNPDKVTRNEYLRLADCKCKSRVRTPVPSKQLSIVLEIEVTRQPDRKHEDDRIEN